MTQIKKLTEPAWAALAEALRTCHWYKNDFQTLVRARFADAPDALAAVNFDSTKREATGQLVMELRLAERKYQGVVIDALVLLSEVDPDFPHLARLDDGADKVAEAKAALRLVQNVTEEYSELAESREAIRREAESTSTREASRRLHDEKLRTLRDRFLAMHQSSDSPQARGLAFEPLLNELFCFDWHWLGRLQSPIWPTHLRIRSRPLKAPFFPGSPRCFSLTPFALLHI